MKVRQTASHLAARAALELPIVGPRVRAKLVALHTRVFLERADEARREERRAHLDAFFDATMDVYLAALAWGYPEATAREITHILANAQFATLGWTEMMEFPLDELDTNLARYGPFFAAHAITPLRPLGDHTPAEGLPAAPATPERLADPTHPHAEVGFGDDVYVEDARGKLQRGDPGAGKGG